MKFKNETGIYEPAISEKAQLLVEYVKSFPGGKINMPNATKSSNLLKASLDGCRCIVD